MADKIKLSLAVLAVIAGIAGFYFLSDYPTVVRVVSVLVGLGIGAAVGSMTEPGRQFAVFARESAVETKKVVWPTRKETMQTTGVVFLLVVLMAVFLWIVDAALAYGVKALMGWGA